ncbi:MAG: alpha/beta hydrolase [Bacteroidales bacterium]|nr:alpha/beta hydrolase [Bacteroidales bacterium]
MKRLIAALVAAFSLSAALVAKDLTPSMTVLLYPEGQEAADAKGIMEDGVYVTLGPGESNGLSGGIKSDARGRLSNIGSEACMDIYLPRKCNGEMIVVCPGGGYSIVSSINEGINVAKWLIKRNIAVCVVKYRLPNKHHTVPLTDVQNAFRYCRAHASTWGVKKIGVMGFSAGGHLAASAATLYTDAATKPDFAVLVYPVITMEEGITHKGTCENLTDGNPKLKEHYSIENRVTSDTPRTLLLLSADDKTVPPENSIRYFEKMVACKVPVEMHIFTSGGHGYGFASESLFAGKNEKKDKLGKGQRKDFDQILERFLLEP